MFGWFKKIMGGARETEAPPELIQAPLPKFAVDHAPVRMVAPMVFRQPANIDPFETMFGIVRLSRKEEVWPSHEGEALAPLLQINLSRAPCGPAVVRDLSLITVFISKAHSTDPTPIIDSRTPDPDATWALRSYPTLEGLTIPKPPVNDGRVVPLLGEWVAVREEVAWDHVPTSEVRVRIVDGVKQYETPRMTPPLSKLGGWPYPAGPAPWWADPSLPDTWDFVMQIENEPKANWYKWGRGAACIARSRQNPHLWATDVQQPAE
jgi:hypothetical protein